MRSALGFHFMMLPALSAVMMASLALCTIARKRRSLSSIASIERAFISTR